jgi:2-C-methyl-D-erythritol 4-phosphate cytidylyltransferase
VTTVDAVVVGAGSGTRLGLSTPKAFVELCGKPMLYYSLETFHTHPSIGRIILVIPEPMVNAAKYIVNKYDALADRVQLTVGGNERWESVRNGVSITSGEWVLIHDAARPFVTHEVIDSLLDKCRNFECAITATPETDTVRTIGEDGRCGVTVDRSTLMRVGTPQMFRRELLISSFDRIESMPAPPTDEAALFESLGIPVGYSWGDPANFKITTTSDLEMAEALLERKQIFNDNKHLNAGSLQICL